MYAYKINKTPSTDYTSNIELVITLLEVAIYVVQFESTSYSEINYNIRDNTHLLTGCVRALE